MGDFPFGWTDYWRFPVGVEFQNIYDSTLLIVLGLVLYPVLGDPVRVYNVSVLGLVLGNVSLSYVAFRTWFRPAVAFAGAVFFGLSFYSLGKLGGHVNLLGTAGFPLFWAAVYRVHREQGSLRSFVWLVVSSLVIAFSSLQYPLLLFGSLPFVGLLAIVIFPHDARALARTLRRRKLVAVLSALVLVAAFSLFHGKKLWDLARGDVVLPADAITTVPPVNFVAPNAYLSTVVAAIPNATRPWVEYTVFLGYVELCLFAAAAFLAPRSRTKWFLLLSSAVVFLLCLGDSGPYPYLFPRMPYRGIIEPARFSIVVLLSMTLLVLLHLREIKSTKWVLAIIALLIAERLPRNFPLSPSYRNPELVAAVHARPTRAVLDLPAYVAWWKGQMHDLYSVYYELPIVTGYVQWSGDTPASQRFVFELRELACYINPDEVLHDFASDGPARKREQLIAELRAHDIRTIVLHKDLIGTSSECGAAPRYIEALLSPPSDWEVLLDTKQKRVLWLRP